MTEVEELFATFLKFQRSGRDARLNVECHTGNVYASLHVNIYQPHPPPSPGQHQHHPHRRATPSRLRRRERRAAARDHAAVEAVATKLIPVDEDEKKASETLDSDEEADVNKCPTAAQAVCVDIPNNNDDDENDDTNTVVMENDELQYPEEIIQEQPLSSLNVLAKPWPNPRAPSNQCDKCGKSFGSNRALTNHVAREHLQDL